MIILAPVEITWARQQSNIYLKLWSCSRHETYAQINYRNMPDSNTITWLLRLMKKWRLKFKLVIRPVCSGLFKPDASTLPPQKNSRRSLNQHHDSADIKRLVYSFEFAFSHLQIPWGFHLQFRNGFKRGAGWGELISAVAYNRVKTWKKRNVVKNWIHFKTCWRRLDLFFNLLVDGPLATGGL